MLHKSDLRLVYDVAAFQKYHVLYLPVPYLST